MYRNRTRGRPGLRLRGGNRAGNGAQGGGWALVLNGPKCCFSTLRLCLAGGREPWALLGGGVKQGVRSRENVVGQHVGQSLGYCSTQ